MAPCGKCGEEVDHHLAGVHTAGCPWSFDSKEDRDRAQLKFSKGQADARDNRVTACTNQSYKLGVERYKATQQMSVRIIVRPIYTWFAGLR